VVTNRYLEMNANRLTCAFGCGQPKRAERDVMRTTWLGSCSRRRPGRFACGKGRGAAATGMPGWPGTAAGPGAP